MEKQTTHCNLSVVKTMIETGNVRATKTVREGATALGFDFDSMSKVVMALTPADFYKSMTTHADYRLWQDVYRRITSTGGVYLNSRSLMMCSSCLLRNPKYEMSILCRSGISA